MAVGVLTRSVSQPELSTTFIKMTRQRRNGLAYIFHGQSREDIFYLKECFTKRLESTSSESDLDTDSDTETDTGADTLTRALSEARDMDVVSDHVSEDENSEDVLENGCSDDETERPVTKPARRVALADIFEGVPESAVNDFLAQYSAIDEDEDKKFREIPRARRMAQSDIFDGISKDKVNEFRARFCDLESETDLSNTHTPPMGYLFQRRGALADIFHDIVDDDLKDKLVQYSRDEMCSGSDESEDLTDSDESGVQVNGHSSDSSLPDEDYLWRRRCALANIFEDIGTTVSRFRAQ